MEDETTDTCGTFKPIAHWIGWGLAAVGWVGLVIAVTTLNSAPDVKIYVTRAHTVSVVTPGQTIYQANPAAVSAILAIVGLCVVVAAASLIWRSVKGVSGVGVVGMAAGVVAGVFALAGLLTFGPWILPTAVLLVLVALPLRKREAVPVLAEVEAGVESDD